MFTGGARGARRHPVRLAINAFGAFATAIALAIIIVSKFVEGAWLIAIVIPGLVWLFVFNRRYQERLWTYTAVDVRPLDLSGLTRPLFVVPMRRLDRVTRKALRFVLGLGEGGETYAVQVLAEELETEDLSPCWHDLIETPVRRAGLRPPELVVLRSPYREFYGPFIHWIARIAKTHRNRHIVIIIPEIIHRRWSHFFLSRRETWLKARLLFHGGPHVIVMNMPWYPDIDPARHPGPVEDDSVKS